MKCPGCKFVSSDLRDICPKCFLDLRPAKKAIGLPVTNPEASYDQLLDRYVKKRAKPDKKKKKQSLISGLMKNVFSSTDKPPIKEDKTEKREDIAPPQQRESTPIQEVTLQKDSTPHQETPINNTDTNKPEAPSSIQKEEEPPLQQDQVVTHHEAESSGSPMSILPEPELKDILQNIHEKLLSEEIVEQPAISKEVAEPLKEEQTPQSEEVIPKEENKQQILPPDIAEQDAPSPTVLDFSEQTENLSEILDSIIGDTELTIEAVKEDKGSDEEQGGDGEFTLDADLADQIDEEEIFDEDDDGENEIDIFFEEEEEESNDNQDETQEEDEGVKKKIEKDEGEIDSLPYEEINPETEADNTEQIVTTPKEDEAAKRLLEEKTQTFSEESYTDKKTTAPLENPGSFEEIGQLFQKAIREVELFGENESLEIHAEHFQSYEGREDIQVLFQLASEELLHPEEKKEYQDDISITDQRHVEAEALSQQLEKVEKAIEQPLLSLKASKQLRKGRDQKTEKEANPQEQESKKELQQASLTHRLIAFLVNTIALLCFTIAASYLLLSSAEPELTQQLLHRQEQLDIISWITIIEFFSIALILLAVLFPLISYSFFRNMPGDLLTKTTLLSQQEKELNLSHILVRSLLYPLSLLTFGYLPLLRKKATLHDSLARTEIFQKEDKPSANQI